MSTQTYYKVVTVIQSDEWNGFKPGDLISAIVRVRELTTVYRPMEWTHAPDEASKNGFGLCVFSTRHDANQFMGGASNKAMQLWECKAQLIELPMPVALTWTLTTTGWKSFESFLPLIQLAHDRYYQNPSRFAYDKHGYFGDPDKDRATRTKRIIIRDNDHQHLTSVMPWPNGTAMASKVMLTKQIA